MKAEEILTVYSAASMFILEMPEVVVGILQDNGVKKKDAEAAYSAFKKDHPFGYAGEPPQVDADFYFRAGMRYLASANDLISFKKAYWTLFVAAVRGHPEALFRLGMLMGGEYDGCPFTEVKSSVKFFRKAAEKGCSEAYVHLALLLGDGFRPDSVDEAVAVMAAEASADGEPEGDAAELTEALKGAADGSSLKKLEELSDRGVSEASVVLDAMYREGRGVPKDDAKADIYWKKAFE